MRQGHCDIILVEQSSLPQQYGGCLPRSSLISWCTAPRRFARLASWFNKSCITFIISLLGRQSSFDLGLRLSQSRVLPLHYLLHYCTLSRIHCQYCSAVITFLLNLAEHVGIEPTHPFLNDRLAICCLNRSANAPNFPGTPGGNWTHMNQLSVAYGI